MNDIFQEDCRKTIKREISYDYVWTSPPGWAELGLEPDKGANEYSSFMREVFSCLCPKNGLITILVTDRKFNCAIWPRHFVFCEIMADLGWPIRSYKIWSKTPRQNVFRVQFSHIMTFGKGRQHKDPGFMDDVFFDKHERGASYRNAHPPSLIRKCIRNHTLENEVVFDPFMGAGSTAIAAIGSGRGYVGSEIDPAIHALASRRILSYLEKRRLQELAPPLFK